MPAHTTIRLSEAQVERAETEALRRQERNMGLGLRGRNRAPATGDRALEMHRLGALGEVAVASHLGLEDHLFTQTDATRHSCDLPGSIEVKTRSKHNYDLIVQRDERVDKKLVLVTIQNSVIRLHGWTYAGEVMKPEFWSDPAGGRPAYFVPKSQLRSMSEFNLEDEWDRGESIVSDP